jgi:hypothetical protein
MTNSLFWGIYMIDQDYQSMGNCKYRPPASYWPRVTRTRTACALEAHSTLAPLLTPSIHLQWFDLCSSTALPNPGQQCPEHYTDGPTIASGEPKVLRVRHSRTSLLYASRSRTWSCLYLVRFQFNMVISYQQLLHWICFLFDHHVCQGVWSAILNLHPESARCAS